MVGDQISDKTGSTYGIQNRSWCSWVKVPPLAPLLSTPVPPKGPMAATVEPQDDGSIGYVELSITKALLCSSSHALFRMLRFL